LAKEQTVVEKVIFENDKKRWGFPQTYKEMRYPDPKKKKDVFVIEVQPKEIAL
jgi:hypothetical protein